MKFNEMLCNAQLKYQKIKNWLTTRIKRFYSLCSHLLHYGFTTAVRDMSGDGHLLVSLSPDPWPG